MPSLYIVVALWLHPKSSLCGFVQIVKQALLYAVAIGVPEQWSPELELAWGEAFDALSTVLKDEMHAQATTHIAT